MMLCLSLYSKTIYIISLAFFFLASIYKNKTNFSKLNFTTNYYTSLNKTFDSMQGLNMWCLLLYSAAMKSGCFSQDYIIFHIYILKLCEGPTLNILHCKIFSDAPYPCLYILSLYCILKAKGCIWI